MVMSTNIRLFWRGVRASWAIQLVDLTPSLYFGMRVPRIILQAIFFVILAKAAGGDELARYALIGNAVHVAVMYAVIFMDVVIEIEKWNDTLVYLIASPASWFPLLLGRSMTSYADAFLSTGIVFMVLIPMMSFQISLVNLFLSVPLILLTVASASTAGWLVGSIALPTRWGNLVSNMLGYFMILLCGINFPLTSLPAEVQAIGNLLPVTHGLLAIREVIDGASYASVLPLIGKEITAALVYGVLAWLVFAYRLWILRKRGSFGLV
jgi:ABC-2 type transport system permease protein